MNDCSNPQAPNTTIPHILPYVLIKDRSIDDILGNLLLFTVLNFETFYFRFNILKDPSIPQSSLVKTCITPFETSTQDFGFSILFAHLDAARSFCNNLMVYKRNAKIVMGDHSRLDSLLEESFR